MHARNMNCERVAGFMSVWFGNFTNEDAYWHYLEDIFCVDNPEQYNPQYNMLEADFEQALAELFKPENAGRPFEDKLREMFDVCFNRFEYDFGVTFDQDFQVGGFCGEPTTDLGVLLGEWQDLAEPFTALLVDGALPKPCNCFFAIPGCRYNGYVPSAKSADYALDFAGVVAEDVYSNELAAEYNG